MIGIALLAFFLCTINILLWWIFLRKFKNLFTVDDVISDARTELNHLIEDLNRNTYRDINLIEDKLKEIKAIIAEADRHVAVAHSELIKQSESEVFKNLINAKNQRVASPKKTLAQRNASSYLKASEGLSSQLSYDITSEGSRALGEQGDLFAQEDSPSVVNNTGTKFTIEQDGTAVASIPKIAPNITFSDNPIIQRKEKKETIKELFEQGYSVEDIATQLKVTTTEVQFSIDMFS